jgi:uncharacterized protein YlxW (UPF0749 family)
LTYKKTLELCSKNLKCAESGSRSRTGREEHTGLMNDLKSMVERVKNLENERKNLLLEIDELKKMADSKAKALESEVGMLREEVRSLRLLLGAEDPDPEVEEEQDLKRKPRK